MTASTVTSRLAAALVVLAATVVGPQPVRADDRSDMFERLGVTEVPGDYLFLVDESGSMASSFDSVKDNLSRFAKALGERDRIAVVSFNSEPDPQPWLGARSDEAQKAINSLPAPESGSTDFYNVLSWAVDHLGKVAADRSRVATVVLLTDGDPASDDLPDCALPPESRWRELRGRVSALDASRVVNAYALPVDAPGKLCTAVKPIDILRNAFSTAEQLNPDNAQSTATYLNQAKEEGRLRKARQLLADGGETTKSVRAVWRQADLRGIDPTDEELVLRASLITSGIAPAKVTLLSATIDVTIRDAGGDHRHTLTAEVSPGEVSVDPDEPTDITVRAPWPKRDSGIAPATVEVTGTVTLTGTVTSPFVETAGGDLPERLKTSFDSAAVQLSGSGSSGLPRSLWITVVLLLVIGGIAVAAIWFRRHPTMTGYMRITPPAGRTVHLELNNLRKAHHSLDGHGTVTVRGTRHEGRVAMTVSRVAADGEPVRGKICPRGGSVMSSGIDFQHLERLPEPASPSGEPDT